MFMSVQSFSTLNVISNYRQLIIESDLVLILVDSKLYIFLILKHIKFE